MIRVHLCQIYYKPAYYDSGIDYLEEPAFHNLDDEPMGKLRSIPGIEEILSECKESYINHIWGKLKAIIDWSSKREAHILVFPEYSIPFQILESIAELAKKNSMMIIAGTHRIQSETKAKDTYRNLGILPQSIHVGAACSPIFLPNGSVEVIYKLSRSKWEQNLNIPEIGPKILNAVCHDKTEVQFAVVPCIDSLQLDILGSLCKDNTNKPDIIFCPSLSPSTDPFEDVSLLMKLKEIPFAYVNTASFGGTYFSIPEEWEGLLKGHKHSQKDISPKIEAVLEVEFTPKSFFIKKGTIENSPPCSYPRFFPIVYKSKSPWLYDYSKMREDLVPLLEDQEIAKEYLDQYLTNQNTSEFPDLVKHNLGKELVHSILPIYDGNIDTVKSILELVEIPDDVYDTLTLWATSVNIALKTLTDIFVKSRDISADFVKNLESLKKQQKTLPEVTSESEDFPVSKVEALYSHPGDDELIKAFQNRGRDLDRIREHFANSENRVIIISGSLGIGKSCFANVMFDKVFRDWEPIRIDIPNEVRFSRIVADIAYRIGTYVDADLLDSITHNVFRQKIRNILRIFYDQPKRVLILDDLYQILKERNPRDYRQMSIFIEEAATPDVYKGGRVVLISSIWLQEKWIHTKGVSHMSLRTLTDLYISRIIEFHMRRTNLVREEAMPDIPQALLDVAKGHPFSAKLIVEALRNKELNEFSNELTIKKISGEVAKELLKLIDLTYDETVIMKKLSLFRLPVKIDKLEQMKELDLTNNNLQKLADRCILNYDGQSLEMHEAIRRFYYEQITMEEIEAYHRLAVSYYQRIYDEMRLSAGKPDPSIIAELVHHLVLCNDISKTRDLKFLIIQEMKPAARKIYKEFRNYARALSLYRMIGEIVPDDIEVLAYIGRCYARINQWSDSDRVFEHAIKTADRIRQPSWWIYRDWGHIRARFSYYDKAEELLNKATITNPKKDASIKAQLAYIYWHRGDKDRSRDLYEEAIEISPYHEYILEYYIKLLDSMDTGERYYADILRERLKEVRSGMIFTEPSDFEYDIDVDFDYDDME